MQKPFLTLTTKDFLTGIAAGAHIGTGGILYKADGVTPLFEAGTTQSANDGLLMAGASGSVVGGTPNGNFIGMTVVTDAAFVTKAYFTTSTDHIFSLVLDATVSNSLADLHTAGSQLVGGIESLYSSSGALFIFYWQGTQIGKYDPTGPTFTDGAFTGLGDSFHNTHKFSDIIYYTNSLGHIGTLVSDGAGSFTNTIAALSIPTDSLPTDISDDGTYIVVAMTNNITANPAVMGNTRVIFWDGNSTNRWQREFPIPDPFIYALEKTPEGVFAFGVTGIWQVSFGGIKKVFSRATGIYNTDSNELVYGQAACSHYGDALLWGGSSGNNYAIKSLGRLDPAAPSAYLHPFLTTASKNITLVTGQVVKGYVLVGDDTPQLKAYPFSSSATPNTGVTAQTVYFPVPEKIAIQRVDLVFGVPLVSGDSISASLYSDEATSATSFGSATFSADGAARRKKLSKRIVADNQFSLLLTYTAGAPKVKAIEFYGTPMTP